MPGRAKWSDIKARRQRGTDHHAARAGAAKAIDATLTLAELRRDRGVREYVHALGGELQIRAVFDDAVIEVNTRPARAKTR
jgi:hypothetical protein